MHDQLTHHALQRCKQRSIRQSDFDAFQYFADSEEPMRGGAVRLTFSLKAARRARELGVPNDQIARLCRFVWIVADGRVVTQYRRPARRSSDRFGRAVAWAK